MSLFHEGDVHSGILSALEQDKAVVCFVRSDNETSDLWDSQWLPQYQDHLAQWAVCLRIDSRSAEAKHLCAYYPVKQYPTLLVIRDGGLINHMQPDIPEAELGVRLRSAVLPSSGYNRPPRETPQSGSAPSSDANSAPEPGAALEPPPPRERTNTPVRPLNVNNEERLRDLRARIEARRQEEGAAPEPPPAREGSNTPVRAPGGSNEGRLRPQQESYMQQQARRKAEAAQERERVRALIEADKQERRARDQQRRALAEQEAAAEQSEPASGATTPKPTHGNKAAIQVRLLDGSTMREQFDGSDTIQTKVRGWVDQKRTDGETPYTFKLVLTPRPSRSITDAEERQCLGVLGLVPSASLALVPVRNFTQAYQAGGSRGFVRGAPMLLLGYLGALFAMLWSLIKQFLGMGGQQAQRQDPQQTPTRDVPSSPSAGGDGTSTSRSETDTQGIRIRTLRDQRAGGEDQQLYNGNQLNFEPTNKDEDEHGDG